MEKVEAVAQEPTPPYVAVLTVTPGLAEPSDAKLNFEAQLSLHPKAIVLVAYATGGTPETLNPYIKQCTTSGIPVFLLSTNYANDTGIQKLSYGVQVDAYEAGAISIKNVNVNHLQDVVSAIQDAVKQGAQGDALRDAIVGKFGQAVPSESEN